MRGILRLGCAGAGVVLLGLAASGCTTVVLSDNKTPAERSVAVERAQLARAAQEVSKTRWPKPEQESWRARLIGFEDSGADVTSSDALDFYIAALRAESDRSERVLADAEQHLRAAAGLVRAAEAAADAVRPAMSDVSIVEGAIGDLRQTRDIYLASLKALARDGDTIDAERTRDLKHAFNDAIRDIGAAADVLADRVANDETNTLAGPRRNTAGSL